MLTVGVFPYLDGAAKWGFQRVFRRFGCARLTRTGKDARESLRQLLKRQMGAVQLLFAATTGPLTNSQDHLRATGGTLWKCSLTSTVNKPVGEIR